MDVIPQEKAQKKLYLNNKLWELC